MKRILTILLLLTSFVVSAQTVGIKIATPIIKNNPIDKTITGYANLLNGGYHVVGTYHGRDSLTTYYTPSLLLGMLCYETSVDSTYRWNGSSWVDASGINIYNSDGTLSAFRTVNLNGNGIVFSGINGTSLYMTDATGNGQIAGGASANGWSSVFSFHGDVNQLSTRDTLGRVQGIFIHPNAGSFGLLSNSPITFQDDGGHTPSTTDSTNTPFNGAGLVNLAFARAHFSSITGAYQPLENQRLSTSNTPSFAGIGLTGRVSQTFNDNFSSNASGLLIDPTAYAQADNISYTGLTVSPNIFVNGHANIGAYSARFLLAPMYVQSDAVVAGNLRTNNIKILGDTSSLAHYEKFIDTAGNRIGTWWSSGQFDVGTNATRSPYLAHIGGSMQVTGAVNMPGLSTVSQSNVLGIDGSGNITKFATPGGGGAVSSVFGRTGAVIAQPTDYANKQSSLNLIYLNNHFTSTNLTTDLTATGFTPTINTTLNSITLSGGGSTSGTQYMLMNNLTNNDQLIDFDVQYVATSVTGGGIRIGKYSINPATTEHISGKYDISTNTWSVGTQLGTNDLFSAPTGNVVSPGDQCEIVMHHRENMFTYTFTDITQGFTTETPVLTQNLNAGNWVITYEGGTVNITSIKITSFTPAYAHVGFITDSKGLFNIPFNYPNYAKSLGNTVVFAGRADATPQILACMPYIAKYNKVDYFVFEFACNDIRYGYSLASTMLNYNKIDSIAVAMGAQVVHLLPIPELSGLNQQPLLGAIKTTYPTATIDVRTNGFDSTKYIGPDNIHPLPEGSKLIGYDIVQSGLIPVQATVYNEAEQQTRNVNNTPSTITSNTFRGSQVFASSSATVTRRIQTYPNSNVDFQIDDNPGSVSPGLTFGGGQYLSLAQKSSAFTELEISAVNSVTHLVNGYEAARGTLAIPLTLNANDVIKQFTFSGFEGTSNYPTSFIRSVVDGTPSTGNMPTRLEFGTGVGTAAAIKLTLLSSGVFAKAGTDVATGTTFRDINYTTVLTPIANNSNLTGLYVGPTFNVGTGILTLSTATTTTADGTYTLLPALGGTGSGAVFTAVVTGGNVVFTQTTGGIGYTNGDNITFSGLTGATPTVTALGYSGGTNLSMNVIGNFKYDPTGTNAAGDIYFRGSTGYMQQLARGTTGQIMAQQGSLLPGWQTTLPTAAIPAFTGAISNTAGSAATTIATSIALPGSPTTTTQTASDNSTKIATTAFVTGAITTANALDAKLAGGNSFTGNQIGSTSFQAPTFIVANASSGFATNLTSAAFTSNQSVVFPDKSGTVAMISDIRLGSGQIALTAGVATITISGLTSSNKGFAQFVSIGGTISTTWQYKAVCTTNTLTITAITNTGTTDTTDTSTLNYNVIP